MSESRGVYEGRLQVDDGDLQAGEGPHAGESVYHDLESNTYRFVRKGDQKHNDLHGKRVASVSGTSGPLYDEQGNKVTEGDPHHFNPLPTDEHFEQDARDSEGRLTHTRPTVHPDGESETVTSHTAAYTKGA